MNKIIELSKFISIEIDDQNNVLKWIPKWDTENDEITVYSEGLNAALKTDCGEKEIHAEYVSFWDEDETEGDIPPLYILHLFDPHVIPPRRTLKHRRRKNKTGAWRSVLFSEQTFKADFSYWEIDDGSCDYCFENVNYLKYSRINISEFLKTEQANYIRDTSSLSNPRKPRWEWQQM